MNEEASFKKETSRLGIDALTPDGTPAPPVEPSISSARPESESLTEADLIPESALWNVGNTRPPQNLQHFDGDEIEKTYLEYFVAGDMHTYRHGTKVRVEGGTTHPAQLELLRDLFGRYASAIYTPTLTPHGD